MSARDASAFAALFDPGGVIVAGASSHPGKFGFVVLHNILRHAYRGRVFATNREGGEILGVTAHTGVDCIPDGVADLVFVCTPIGANAELLRACARKGVRAAFVMTSGYAETGDEGRRAEAELASVAEEVGILLAGPNGQGIVSTPSSLCAQMVAPYPPPGRIGIASQSGNIVSSFENLAIRSGIGVSRAVSAGNAAVVGIADYLEFFAADPATDVGLAYLEGVRDGRALFEALRRAAREQPLVLVQGGATAGGRRAAASHTGALASNERIFSGMCRQAGVNLAATVEEAFDAAATFATQPLPRGPNVAVLTTAGGWGVLTADSLVRSELSLLTLPDDLRAAIDALLPPRWSHGNPIDLAASESRDTIPDVLELLGKHPAVHAVIFLGSGVQSNQAKLMRSGQFSSGHGLERIIEFHERQDARYAQVAAAVSAASGKPVLVATELAATDPDNPGPRTVRDTGKLCYWSASRAVTALEHLWRRARFLQRRGQL
ncbi:MAG: CoA-binding protein [Acidimicrobiia bacterium]